VNFPTAPDRPAFSLLEVLVAMAVLSVVMLIMLQTTSASLGLWKRSENKIAAGKEGRAATLAMAQDLQNIVIPASPALWPQARPQSLAFLVARPPDYQSGATNMGDICFVEYRVVYEQQRSFIQRGEVESGATLRALTNNPPRFPTATNFQMLATNVFAIGWKLLDARGSTNRALGDPGTWLEVGFSVAPSREAYLGLWDGRMPDSLQIEKVLLRSALPPPQ
jgi:prepilin-type N-terminal cleavage/methylation domain-containing protein